MQISLMTEVPRGRREPHRWSALMGEDEGVTTTVRLTGRLICATDEEAAVVAQHLPLHIALTRAEPGCEAFEVSPSAEPGVWLVSERFRDAAAFRAHQTRVADGEWGRATRGIERQYDIQGL